MHTALHIDIETYCDLELKTHGVYKYVEHPSYKILLFSYADDTSVITTYQNDDWQNDANLMAALVNPDVNKIAHNAQFEFTGLSKYIDNLDYSQWECTMVMCSQMGLPMSLDMAAQVLKLDGKLKDGKALINTFSKPQRNGKRILPQHAPDKWFDFIAYNQQDVNIEREIYRKLGRFGLNEKKLFVIDHNINKRGVMVDEDMAKKVLHLANDATASAYGRLMSATGLDRPTDNAIKAKYGIQTLNKKDIPEVYRSHPELKEILDLRTALSKTSIAKYETMLACALEDGRARGLTQFYGAGRTGRWSGKLIQLQNLPRITATDTQLEQARATVKLGDSELFDLLYGDSRLDMLSQLIRTAIIPRPRHKFVVLDFSAIEARVLAWISGEDWRLAVFNSHGRIYEASAERMFNLPAGSVGKDSPLRQKGKVAELALGYGGSVGALCNMGALDMGLEERELKPLVTAWRNANQKVVAFWHDLDNKLFNTLMNGNKPHRNNWVRVTNELGVLQICLPNGRKLTYQSAWWDGKEARYMGVNQKTNQWWEHDLYGAKATENVIQAIARDCLAEVIIYAEEQGFNPVFHVHDEIVCEVEEERAEEAYTKLLGRMSYSPTWATGLPLRGDGFICDYYRK